MKYSSNQKNERDCTVTVRMSAEDAEKPSVHQRRHRSHLIMFSSTIMFMVGSCVIQNGSWAYLNRVTKTADKVSYGWIVSLSAVGPIVFCPIFGYLANRMKSVRVPCMLCLGLLITGNIFYSLLYAFEGMGRTALFCMAIARLLIGMGGVLPSLIQTYIVSSTTKEERSSKITLNFASNELGYVLGACLQTLIGLKFNVRIDMGLPGMVIDKFNVGGWLAVLIGILNLIILLPGFFQEVSLQPQELKQNISLEKSSSESRLTTQKPNYVGATTIVLICGMVVTLSSQRETLGAPMIEDLYAVSSSMAAVLVSAISAGCGLAAVIILLLIFNIINKYDNRKVLIWVGLLSINIGLAIHYPLMGNSIPLARCDNSSLLIASSNTAPKNSFYIEKQDSLNSYSLLTSISKNTESFVGEKDCFGCPYKEQPWCETTKLIEAPQMIFAYFITRIGLGVTLTALQTLYSKIIGASMMGVWIGLLTTVTTFSKLVSPIWLAYLYQDYGPVAIFATLVGLISLSMILGVIFFKQMAPIVSKKE